MHQVGERAEGLLDVGVRAGPVHLVEVDVVGAEARSESSTARMIQRRDPPRGLGSSAFIGMKNFVARNTSSRRPFRASPTISSETPAE